MPNHPSFNSQSALFIIAVEGGTLFVEAKNSYAVQAMELVAGKNGMFGTGLNLVAVVRDYDSIGYRTDEGVATMGHCDFLMKVVDPDLMDSPSIKECIAYSLSDYERGLVQHYINSDTSEDLYETTETNPVTSPNVIFLSDRKVKKEVKKDKKDTIQTKNQEKLFKGLVGLGFKKNEVTAYIKSISTTKLEETNISDLIRSGIEALCPRKSTL